jgi:hypothetical protein
LPGTVDSSPIYLHDVEVKGVRRDVFVMTTTYGLTVALDATSDQIVWVFRPSTYRSYAGTYRITTSAPAADPDRRHVFASSPDGRIHRLVLSTGAEDTGGSWPVTVTRLPEREKLTSAINVTRGHVIVTSGGYIGDQPPYQGHVVLLDQRSGRIAAVFNSLCGKVRRLLDPRTCPSQDSAIWSRGGVTVEPDGKLLFATGNGPNNGRTDLGDSVVELTPDAGRVLQHWTPRDAAQLNAQDLDVGSTGPVLTWRGTVVQGGKDQKLHVLSLGHLAREVQTLPAPASQKIVTSQPAVWRHGRDVTLFATSDSGTAAYAVDRRGRLNRIWENGTTGTSPVVAGGLLYVYDPHGDGDGGLVVYDPLSGRRLAKLPAGGGHWNAPVLGGGRIALPTIDANSHLQTGSISLYSLPRR